MGESMTLAVDRRACEALADPAAALTDARQWTEAVGVVGDDGRRVATYVRDEGLPQDFFPGDRGKVAALEFAEHQYPAERLVLVGARDADRRLAEQVGWEYLDVTEAAEKADWELASDEPGVLESVRRRLPF